MGARFSRSSAKPGEIVDLVAEVTGFEPDTPVVFRIFETTKDPGEPLAVLRSSTTEESGGKLATAQWVYRPTGRVQEPKFLFEVDVEGYKGLADEPLTIVLPCVYRFVDADGEMPVKGVAGEAVDSYGGAHPFEAPDDGKVTLGEVPIGTGEVTLRIAREWQLLDPGATPDGELAHDSGARLTLKVRRRVFLVDIEAPEDGASFLAGDRFEVRPIVTRLGDRAEGLPVELVAPPETLARLDGRSVRLSASYAGPVEVTASYGSARATVVVNAVKPRVIGLELDAAGPREDLVPLFDPDEGDRMPPRLEWEGEGPEEDEDGNVVGPEQPSDEHPGAFRLGALLRARAYLYGPLLGAPATIAELALETPPLDDAGTPFEGAPFAGKPLVFRSKGPVEIPADWSAPIELEADRPLPFAVAVHDWTLAPRLTIGEGEAARTLELGPVGGVRLFAVWGAALVADGSDYDLAFEPLKAGDLDPFHVEKAVELAAGCWNLREDDPGSIPAALCSGIRHHAYPDDYEGKDGREATDHDAPANLQNLRGERLYRFGRAKVCGRCGGAIGVGGTCVACERYKVDEFRCAKCKTELDLAGANATFCQQCRSYVGRAIAGALECPACRTLNAPGLVYDPHTRKVYDGERLEPALRAKQRPLDFCYGCKAALVRVEARCPGLDAWILESDVFEGRHECPREVDPTIEVEERTHFGRGRWGLDVLDHPIRPGGQPPEQASCAAALLGVIGVRARVFYVRARRNGAVLQLTDKPVTLGSNDFDWTRDWGPNLYAAVLVPPDRARDAETRAQGGVGAGVKLVEDEPVVFDVAYSDPPKKKRARTSQVRTQLVKAVVYPCPGCGETVHEGQRACWNCKSPLTLRELIEVLE